MTEIDKLVRMSKYAGERFDLVQAGGGNSSVKLDDGIMLIKASGCLLSDIGQEKGFSRVRNREVVNILGETDVLQMDDKRERARRSSELLVKTVVSPSPRPSIETFMHAILSRYVLHTHPLAVNAVTCKKDWVALLETLFSGKAAYVAYRTPGFELALELKKVVLAYEERNSREPEIIFLQNHGLIINTDRFEDVQRLTEEVVQTVEQHLGIDLDKYKITNRVSDLVSSVADAPVVSALCSDSELARLLKDRRELFSSFPFCPDGLVYCGMRPLEITSLDDASPFARFREEYGDLPKVILYNNLLFFAAPSLRKAWEIEAVFKFHIMTLDLARCDVDLLSEQELGYLSTWEAEQYRRKL